jgi:hypothetical protein
MKSPILPTAIKATFLIPLIVMQGCIMKRELVNPYQDPNPAETPTARVRIVGPFIGSMRASVYKNPSQASCMKAESPSDLKVFSLGFLGLIPEKSIKSIDMPELYSLAKVSGVEYYFKAGEPIVIGANWSITTGAYYTTTHSCRAAKGFTPVSGKDYELNFMTVPVGKRSNKMLCTASLAEIQPDMKNEGKFIGLDIPLNNVALYSSDEEVATNCGQRPNR